MAVRLTLVEGQERWGLIGRVPRRVDAATKSGLLELVEHTLGVGWTLRQACEELALGEVRAYRWIARRAIGELADKPAGGSPVHGLLAEEAAEILVLFDEWGKTDRPNRKLAHRGSYLGRVWVVAVERAAGASPGRQTLPSLAIKDPATLRAELAVTREHWNSVRLHAGIGYVTPNDERLGRGEAIRKAR